MNTVSNDICINHTGQKDSFNEGVRNDSRQFFDDVVEGLSHSPKKLPSKYFYDATGDRLFQEIMHSPDYYPTRCELEIFSTKGSEIAQLITNDETPFDLIELGAGDCYKSVHLMKELMRWNAVFNYIPIDISGAILNHLESSLPTILPGMPIKCMHGEYFQMLRSANKHSGNRKVILFLGGNIGNMTIPECDLFCQNLHECLDPGDLVIIGFDLVKNPRIIRTAYDDHEGVTKKFNLNLLDRINKELGANFNLNDFEHYCSYEPETGACKSFLICLADRTVWIGDAKILFKKNEYIWMEISQKYTIEQIDDISQTNGFLPIINLMDNRKWFVDACWKVI